LLRAAAGGFYEGPENRALHSYNAMSLIASAKDERFPPRRQGKNRAAKANK